MTNGAKKTARFIVGDPCHDLKGSLARGRFSVSYDLRFAGGAGWPLEGATLRFDEPVAIGELDGVTANDDGTFVFARRESALRGLALPIGKDLAGSLTVAGAKKRAGKGEVVQVDIVLERTLSRLGAGDAVRGAYTHVVGGVRMVL